MIASLALLVAAHACDDDTARTSGPTTVASTTSSSTSAEVTGACETTSGPVDAASTLTLGPAPGIPASTARGEPVIISGTVYDERCAPLDDVSIHVWQTDADGVYGPGHGTDELRCCYLQGTVRTDPRGRYRLITVMPGHYAGQQAPPPAHIHVEAQSASGGSVMAEIVFADDPYLSNRAADGYVVVTLAAPDDDGTRRGVADLVLD